MARIARAWAVGEIPDDVYRETMAELRRAESAAAAELARIGPVDTPDPVQTASAVDALLALWPRMTPAEQVRALRTVVDKVVIRRAAHWREPEEQRVEVQFRW